MPKTGVESIIRRVGKLWSAVGYCGEFSAGSDFAGSGVVMGFLNGIL